MYYVQICVHRSVELAGCALDKAACDQLAVSDLPRRVSRFLTRTSRHMLHEPEHIYLVYQDFLLLAARRACGACLQS